MSITGHFVPSRADGRSDRQVVLDLAQNAEPETMFGYDDLVAALESGIDTDVERERVYRAVGRANRALLRERRRYLRVVPGVGYRMMRSDEHLPLALDQKATAATYLKKGMDLLRHVRLDELDEPHRRLHVGQLLILAAHHQAIESSNRRHSEHDRAINDLRERIDKIERADTV